MRSAPPAENAPAPADLLPRPQAETLKRRNGRGRCPPPCRSYPSHRRPVSGGFGNEKSSGRSLEDEYLHLGAHFSAKGCFPDNRKSYCCLLSNAGQFTIRVRFCAALFIGCYDQKLFSIGHHVIVPQLRKPVSLAGVFLFPEKVTQIKCPLS